MLALYHWHPYEMRALLCGLGAGVLVGIQLGRLLVWWWHRHRVRAAIARAKGPRSRA